MRYLSPASLFGDSSQFISDKKAIQLGRKKLLAELELSGGDSILIQGIPFTKNSIIDYFDDLLKGESVAYHHAIEEDSVLKTFLQGYMIEEGSRFKENELYEDYSFIQWISPWFLSAFTAYISDCFDERDDTGLRTILNNRLLLTDPDIEKAWAPISRTFNDHISLLKDYQRQDKHAPEEIPMESISYTMEYLYTGLIQLLPENRFGEIRDKYAFVMMQACIYTFNRNVSNRSQAICWMDNAILLAVSEELKNELSDKLEEMSVISASHQNRSRYSYSKKTGKSTNLEWRVLFFALIALIRIAATCNSSDSQSNYNYQNVPVFMTKPGDSVKQILLPSNIDSILKSMHRKPYQ